MKIERIEKTMIISTDAQTVGRMLDAIRAAIDDAEEWMLDRMKHGDDAEERTARAFLEGYLDLKKSVETALIEIGIEI